MNPEVPQFALAGSFLEGLAAQDFGRIGTVLTDDVELRALLPGGLRQWTGAGAIARAFATWFGDTQEFELLEAAIGEVGGRNGGVVGGRGRHQRGRKTRRGKRENRSIGNELAAGGRQGQLLM